MALTAESQGNGTPIWFYPVTWALVIVGWLIVNWQNNRREERKEIRTALAKIFDDIDSLQREAITYHTAKRKNFNLETQIVMMESRLSEHLGYLRIRNSSYMDQYSLFVDAITLDNFQSATFIRQAPSSLIIENIRDTSSDLESALELEFSKLFRGNFVTKTGALIKQAIEQQFLLGGFARFMDRKSEAIITLTAYIFLVGFIFYALRLIPS
ncbi:hypothetical protein [Pseudomonas yamanorum]|uniref:hypothetical protein n=1 Tax=Pseudomonas yamanorum TaxID=515393 RepID=UPI0007A4EC1B|nr:hypothetical protein [Pseudomonas yamanorum]